MTGFDSAHAGTGSFQGTGACYINVAGTITGTYIDGQIANHGFLCAPDGTITSFDFSGVATGPGQGTATGGEGPPSPVW